MDVNKANGSHRDRSRAKQTVRSSYVKQHNPTKRMVRPTQYPQQEINAGSEIKDNIIALARVPHNPHTPTALVGCIIDIALYAMHDHETLSWSNLTVRKEKRSSIVRRCIIFRCAFLSLPRHLA